MILWGKLCVASSITWFLNWNAWLKKGMLIINRNTVACRVLDAFPQHLKIIVLEDVVSGAIVSYSSLVISHHTRRDQKDTAEKEDPCVLWDSHCINWLRCIFHERRLCLQWVDLLEFGHAYIMTLPISLFPKLLVSQALSLKQDFLIISLNSLFKERVPVSSVTPII